MRSSFTLRTKPCSLRTSAATSRPDPRRRGRARADRARRLSRFGPLRRGGRTRRPRVACAFARRFSKTRAWDPAPPKLRYRLGQFRTHRPVRLYGVRRGRVTSRHFGRGGSRAAWYALRHPQILVGFKGRVTGLPIPANAEIVAEGFRWIVRRHRPDVCHSEALSAIGSGDDRRRTPLRQRTLAANGRCERRNEEILR